MKKLSDQIITETLSLLQAKANELKQELKSISGDIKSALSIASEDDDKLGLLLLRPLLYELPITHSLALYFYHMGLLDRLAKLKNVNNPNLEVLKLADDDSLIDGLEIKMTGENLFLLQVFIYTLQKNITSIEIYGVYISELLEKGRNGNDDSLFKAIQIDRTVLSTPTFINRIAIAEIKNDKRFFSMLKKSIKNPSRRRWVAYDSSRMIAKALTEAQLLDELSTKELYQIFCEDLKIYPKTGEEPERNLRQFIYRYQKETST